MMSEGRKKRSGIMGVSQPRAARAPVSSLWADLIPAEPDFDDLDLSPLGRSAERGTSPALTLGDTELPVHAVSEASVERSPSLDSSESELSHGASQSPPRPSHSSSEFDSFEALDADVSDEKRREIQLSRASAISDGVMGDDVMGDSVMAELSGRSDHGSAERFTEPPLISQKMRSSWLLKYHASWSLAALLLLIGLSIEMVTSTPLLSISKLELNVKGSHVTERDVEKLLKGNRSTNNLITFDLEHFKQQLETMPWVQRADVHRLFPDTLKVDLIEHQAAGVVVFRQLYAVNSRGELLAKISPVQAISLPLVSGVPQELFNNPEDAEIGRYLIRRGLKVSELYHELELDALRSLSEVHVSETGYVELILKKTRVTLGNGHFERHLEDLREILLTLKRKGVDAQYILMSSDFTRAIVKEGPLRLEDEEVSQ